MLQTQPYQLCDRTLGDAIINAGNNIGLERLAQLYHRTQVRYHQIQERVHLAEDRVKEYLLEQLPNSIQAHVGARIEEPVANGLSHVIQSVLRQRYFPGIHFDDVERAKWGNWPNSSWSNGTAK